MTTASVMLYWLPLGAGGHCIRRNGRIFEALMATNERCSVLDPHTPRSRFASATTATSSR